MAKSDGLIKAKLLLADVSLGIDELGALAGDLRGHDPALTALLMVRGRAFQAVLDDLGEQVTAKLEFECEEFQKLPGKTVMRWNNARQGAGVILLEEGSIYLRKKVGAAWKFHAKLKAGEDPADIVKSLPGGPYGLMQKGKVIGEKVA